MTESALGQNVRLVSMDFREAALLMTGKAGIVLESEPAAAAQFVTLRALHIGNGRMLVMNRRVSRWFEMMRLASIRSCRGDACDWLNESTIPFSSAM